RGGLTGGGLHLGRPPFAARKSASATAGRSPAAARGLPEPTPALSRPVRVELPAVPPPSGGKPTRRTAPTRGAALPRPRARRRRNSGGPPRKARGGGRGSGVDGKAGPGAGPDGEGGGGRRACPRTSRRRFTSGGTRRAGAFHRRRAHP